MYFFTFGVRTDDCDDDQSVWLQTEALKAENRAVCGSFKDKPFKHETERLQPVFGSRSGM